MPRLNDLRLEWGTPKHETCIVEVLTLYTNDINQFYKNLSSSKGFLVLYHFSIWIKFPPQFELVDMFEGCIAIGQGGW